MKRVLCIIIGLNLVGGGKTFADDSLTGLHLGFGLNVVADEYKSDVDVLGIAKYASGDKWTFTGPELYGFYLTGTASSTYYKGDFNNIGAPPNPELLKIGGDFNNQNINLSIKQHNCMLETELIKDDDNNNYSSEDGTVSGIYQDGDLNLTIKRAFLTVDRPMCLNDSFIDDIVQKTSGNSSEKIYADKHAINISKTGDNAYLNTSKHLKGRTNKIGGELKMSYFHNLTDHVVLGVDVCGTLNQKAKKNIGVDKLNYVTNVILENTENKEYKISYEDEETTKIEATYDNGKFTNTTQGWLYDYDANKNLVNEFFKTAEDENGVTYIPARTYTIESAGGSSVDTSQIIADNPGYTALEAQPSDQSQYLQISNEKGGDVSFEKNKFNSRAAVVLGAQYKGWFAGVRGGVSYNQGKLHVKDSTGTSSEEVSFASPFVGVHLMKSVNMKGLENGHIYVTADVNVQNKQNLKMKGIKNFRQNSVNVSLGMTWQIN